MRSASDCNSLVPVRVYDELTLLQIQELRRRAWSANGELPDFIAKQNIIADEHDIHGLHWAILLDGQPISAARMCIHNTVDSSPDPEAIAGYENMIFMPLASLTRLVVHPDFRGCGLSSALDQVRITEAELNKCSSIISVTETIYRIHHLQRLGFIRLGITRMRYLSYAESHVMLKMLAQIR
jgi:GNAT superfamily N-acetyltransferase